MTSVGPAVPNSYYNFVGHYAVPKPEYREEIKAVMAQKRLAATELYEKSMVETPCSTVLTEEQKAMFAEKYDFDHLTKEEYSAFIDDLCENGILLDVEKNYVNYSAPDSNLTLIPLEFAETGGYSTTLPFTAFKEGDSLMEYARYTASFREYNEAQDCFKPTRSAVAYQKILDVLLQVKEK